MLNCCMDWSCIRVTDSLVCFVYLRGGAEARSIKGLAARARSFCSLC